MALKKELAGNSPNVFHDVSSIKYTHIYTRERNRTFSKNRSDILQRLSATRRRLRSRIEALRQIICLRSLAYNSRLIAKRAGRWWFALAVRPSELTALGVKTRLLMDSVTLTGGWAAVLNHRPCQPPLPSKPRQDGLCHQMASTWNSPAINIPVCF